MCVCVCVCVCVCGGGGGGGHHACAKRFMALSRSNCVSLRRCKMSVIFRTAISFLALFKLLTRTERS